MFGKDNLRPLKYRWHCIALTRGNSPYEMYGAILSDTVCLNRCPDEYADGRRPPKPISLYEAWLTHLLDLLMDHKWNYAES